MSKVKLLYQYLIALPILLVATVLCALITIICIPWKNSWWLHTIQSTWAKLFCWLFFIPVSVQGIDYIRPNQSYVFVSNHQSYFDIFLIYGWLPVVFKWLMKKEISRIPIVGTACKAAGHIAVDRSHAKAAADSLLEIEKQLVNGVSTVIFPEGTRTHDGEVARFKRGAFQIAWELNLPVIPIRIDGCYQVMSRHARSVTRHPISMTVMPELNLHQFASMEEATAAVREMIVQAK